MRLMKNESRIEGIVKLFTALSSLSLPQGLYSLHEEDKVFYQVLSATFAVRRLMKE